ncbi:MAG TPA: glycosyltransferase family 4 protein, partial [Elusimicrobiota bacterium]|nr:glycosyltransferase family 4 protein [Elusimicrobiota bacterium]
MTDWRWDGRMAASGTVFLAVLVFHAVLLRWKHRLPVDHPNDRSLHSTPTPRIGGLALIPGLLLGVGVLGRGMSPLLGLAAALGLFSFLDDRFGLPVTLRLAIHLGAAVVFTGLGGFWSDLRWGIALTFLIVWGTNLFNFMDGSDGLAGGMAFFGFAAYGAAAGGADHPSGLLASGIAAGAAGFLLFNFPPARVFLGDAGSIPLGFLAAAMGVEGWARGRWPAWFPALVFAPFWVDATVTLVRRTLRGEPVWRAHRTHYYQRLIQMGWGHRKMALVAYGLMALCAAGGVALRRASAFAQRASLACAAVGAVVVMADVDRSWRRR